jgi:hypothetical protein
MLRTIVLEHAGHQYQATVRNFSTTGALVEGLWNVPPGTVFRLRWAKGLALMATARWSQNDRMGIEFAHPEIIKNISTEVGSYDTQLTPELRRVAGQ